MSEEAIRGAAPAPEEPATPGAVRRYGRAERCGVRSYLRISICQTMKPWRPKPEPNPPVGQRPGPAAAMSAAPRPPPVTRRAPPRREGLSDRPRYWSTWTSIYRRFARDFPPSPFMIVILCVFLCAQPDEGWVSKAVKGEHATVYFSVRTSLGKLHLRLWFAPLLPPHCNAVGSGGRDLPARGDRCHRERDGDTRARAALRGQQGVAAVSQHAADRSKPPHQAFFFALQALHCRECWFQQGSALDR